MQGVAVGGGVFRPILVKCHNEKKFKNRHPGTRQRVPGYRARVYSVFCQVLNTIKPAKDSRHQKPARIDTHNPGKVLFCSRGGFAVCHSARVRVLCPRAGYMSRKMAPAQAHFPVTKVGILFYNTKLYCKYFPRGPDPRKTDTGAKALPVLDTPFYPYMDPQPIKK